MHRQLSGRDSNHFGKGIIQISGVNFPHRGLRGRAAAGLRVSTPGELRPADRCLPRLAVHTYGVRIHTHSVCKSPVLRLKSVESSFDDPSGRRFPHKMSWNVGRWMTTEFHTVPRTLMTPCSVEFPHRRTDVGISAFVWRAAHTWFLMLDGKRGENRCLNREM